MISLILLLIIFFSILFFSSKEGIKFYSPSNIKNWPYYYYTFPFYHLGGQWPPGMYTRMRYFYPGFNVSGYSYWLRPGISYTKWPRGRWVRNNNSYYFISN